MFREEWRPAHDLDEEISRLLRQLIDGGRVGREEVSDWTLQQMHIVELDQPTHAFLAHFGQNAGVRGRP